MNIKKGVKKEYWDYSFKELLNAPVSALIGISEYDAKLLKEALGIETINDYAQLQSVKWARSIMTLAQLEE
ncbi:hypothetical protein [Acetivibrio mesophilus]|uniref:Uncharacterized protein n=1 Tax=Acetivibrio mesophilus TaxID=2487273 RepID=A0A4Q0I0I9_9FIRM|nr:hypothetical protein [Acetivibrio mesophilus]RXE57720.1 hypothetical protein EFD62_16025 [Acetivibrio mesophilus]